MNYDENENELLNKIANCRRESQDHQNDWQIETRESYEFVAGNQWADEDKARLEELQRPCATFNRVGPVIDAIVGYEINNKRVTRYMPRSMNDGNIAEVLNMSAEWVRDRCNAEFEENDAFRDALICGMGFIETRIDDDLDPEGRIVQERVSPLEMRWDPSSRKQNLEDANWLSREKWWLLDEVYEKFPEIADDLLIGMEDLGNNTWSKPHDATNAWRYQENATSNWYDKGEGRVLIAQYQWRERATDYTVTLPDGREFTFDEDRWNRLKERLPNTPVREHQSWKYYQALVAGPTVIETEELPHDGFSIRAITGKREEETGLWYGLVRSMKSPQMWSNVFFSTAMSALQSNSKGGVMIEDGAVNDLREFEDKWADAGGVVHLNSGALSNNMVQERSYGGYPPALDKLMQFSINSIRDVSGVNMELLGMVGHEQAGVVETERKQSSLTILAPFFNSMKRYRITQGNDLMELMRFHLKPGQVVRITDLGEPVWWRDPGTQKYDVVISDAESSPNLKNEVWSSLQNILPAYLRTGMPIPPSIIKFMPIPDSVANDWMSYMEQQMQQQMQQSDIQGMQQQMQQMGAELQKLQQENMSLKEKRETEIMKLQQRQAESQMDLQVKEQEMLMDMKFKEMELAMKQKMDEAELATKLRDIDSRYDLEMKRIMSNNELQRGNTEAQMQAQQVKAVIDLHNEREKRKLAAESMSFENQIDDEDKIEIEEGVKNSRKRIITWLKGQGGELAKLAETLNE